jgi:endo-1,4-beta-xylanase
MGEKIFSRIFLLYWFLFPDILNKLFIKIIFGIGGLVMKSKLMFLILIFISFLSSTAFSQEDAASEVTPEAIKARIEKYRMGDIVVKTKPGSDVKIQQVRHEFLFGTAIPNSLAENETNSMSSEDRKMFLKILSENFNYAVHENALKWYDCEKEQNIVDYTTADRIWHICDSLNIPMRGHCIFWAKDKYIMPWLKKLDNDELRAAIHKRAMGVAEHFKGRIKEYDLNNEMIQGDFFRRRLGYGIINEMAYMVFAGDPDVRICVNDYGILDQGYNASTYITQIENLIANGVPVGGIGCQAHLAMTTESFINSPVRVQKTLDQLDKFNLPIKITECLFIFDDEEVQAQELKKLFPIYFADPHVEAILMWGFWEGDHWQPHAAMWKKDWTPRPQALAYRDLLFKQWWTQLTDKADKSGDLKVRAFYGDYIITSNGVSKKVSLHKIDKVLHVTFD